MRRRVSKALALSLAVVVGLILVAPKSGAITTTDWKEYEANPVYAPGHKAYYPTVLYDADRFGGGPGDPTYKMWYASSGCKIGYAHSTDGTHWTFGGFVAGLTVGCPNHPLVEYDAGGFGAGAPYRIWYWTGTIYSINAMAYAESSDGINWTNVQHLMEYAGSVIGPPAWRGSYGPCDILYHPSALPRYPNFDEVDMTNNRFVMYYDLTTGGDESIGLAFSDDGINWVGYSGNPVLRGTQPWETGGREYVSRCTVIFDGTTYHMWYSGGIGKMNEGIGYAASSNGITWTKDSGNPIFHKNDGVPWRSKRTYCPMVIDDKMWLSGKDDPGNYTIGLAVPVVPPPRGLKEEAIDELEALKPTGEPKLDKKIDKIIDHIEKSLRPDRWVDDNHLDPKHGKKVFDEEKKAVKELIKIEAPDVSGAIDALVGADEALAQAAIDQATAAGGDAKEIAKAQKEMAKAQEKIDEGKFDKAIEHCKKAWEHAQKAMK